MDTRSDEELLVAARADNAAFEEFYRRQFDKVVGFAVRRVDRPEDVADLVGAVFLKAVESIGRFDPDRGRALPWLFGLAAHALADEQRRLARTARAHRRLAGHRLLDPNEHLRVEERLDTDSTTHPCALGGA